MRELKVTQTISYRWWRDGNKTVKKAHVEALKESAMERITSQMSEGFSSGELNDNIHMTNRDPEDGIEYHGFWQVKEN